MIVDHKFYRIEDFSHFVTDWYSCYTNISQQPQTFSSVKGQIHAMTYRPHLFAYVETNTGVRVG